MNGPSGREFLLRVSGVAFLISLVTVAIISVYLVTLLQLAPAQWWGFAQIVALLFGLLFGVVTAINLRLIAPVRRFLEAEESGESSPILLALQAHASSFAEVSHFLAEVPEQVPTLRIW